MTRLLLAAALLVFATPVVAADDAGEHGLCAEVFNLHVAGPDVIEGDVTFQNNGTNDLSIYVGDEAGNAPPVFHPAPDFSLVARNPTGQQYQLPVLDPLAGCSGRCGQVRILIHPHAMYAIHLQWRLANRETKALLLPAGSYKAYVQYDEISVCATCWTGHIQSNAAALTVPSS
jgi:hypothetical protein